MKNLTAFFLILCAVLFTASCANTPPPDNVVIENEVPASLLRCPKEPPETPPTGVPQIDAQIFAGDILRVRDAGEDCRFKLEEVRKILEKEKAPE